MAFVNEKISDEDIKKYRIKEMDEKYVVGGRVRVIGQLTEIKKCVCVVYPGEEKKHRETLAGIFTGGMKF